mmetsp:Transcript_15261/g.32291  ORF Transcript_15261/g.32291 Transcript_15261/m.32291 type:complete len:116 (-) Transcript_15261:116-463(-)
MLMAATTNIPSHCSPPWLRHSCAAGFCYNINQIDQSKEIQIMSASNVCNPLAFDKLVGGSLDYVDEKLNYIHVVPVSSSIQKQLDKLQGGFYDPSVDLMMVKTRFPFTHLLYRKK